jgi:hypothetical protein
VVPRNVLVAQPMFFVGVEPSAALLCHAQEEMMTGNRSRKWLLVGLAALGLACSKGTGGVGGVAGGGSKLEGPAASAMDVLPRETGLVFGFSWTSFKQTNFYPMLTSALPKEGADRLAEIKQTCGIDVMNDLESIIVGSGGNLDQSRMLILVKGKWNEDKASKCAAAMGPKMGKPVATAKDGNITTYTVEGEQPVHVGWSGDTMVLTPAAMEGDRTYLADMLKQTATVKDNKPFMDLLGKVDTSATLWAAVLPPPDSDMTTSLQQLTGGTEKVTGGWMSLKLTSRLETFGGVRMASEAEAKTVHDKMAQELEGARKNPQMGEFLKSATVTQAGSDVNLRLTLDEAQMTKLSDMLKQMLPMLGMMLGGG